MYWKKASLFITTAKAVGDFGGYNIVEQERFC